MAISATLLMQSPILRIASTDDVVAACMAEIWLEIFSVAFAGHLAGTLICVQFNERFGTKPGEEVNLQVDVDQVHVFGATSQQRL